MRAAFHAIVAALVSALGMCHAGMACAGVENVAPTHLEDDHVGVSAAPATTTDPPASAHPFTVVDIADDSTLFLEETGDFEGDPIIHPESSLSSAPSAESSSRGKRSDRAPFAFGAFWAPSQAVSGQDTDLAMIRQGLDFSLPLAILPEGRGVWLALFEVNHLQFETDAVLVDSGFDLPNHLWDVGFGTMHIRTLDSGIKLGAIVMVGSASDRPFDAFRDWTLTSVGFVNVPTRNKRDSWNFSLFYSPNSQIVFPIPGVAYIWQPNERVRASIGIPFSLDWQMTETLALAASYQPLTTGRVMLRQQLGLAWTLYGGYDVVNETYFLSERIDDDERFYVFDQRAVLGIERALAWGFTLDVSAGYLFDRQLFQGTSFSDDRRDEIFVDSGLGLLLRLIWTR